MGYQVIHDVYATCLTPEIVTRAKAALNNSERFCLDGSINGEDSVLLRQTRMPVGFISTNTLGFCFPENLNFFGKRDLRKAHDFLARFYSILL